MKKNSLLANQNGVALVIVMLVLSLSLVVISMLMYILNADTRMVYDHSSLARADQIAELAADLAINEWILFINHKHDDLSDLGQTVLITKESEKEYYFKRQLDNSKNVLISKLSDKYGSNNITINYSYSADVIADYEVNPSQGTLIVDIEGEYDGEVTTSKVMLRYCQHGDTKAYKGTR